MRVSLSLARHSRCSTQAKMCFGGSAPTDPCRSSFCARVRIVLFLVFKPLRASFPLPLRSCPNRVRRFARGRPLQRKWERRKVEAPASGEERPEGGSRRACASFDQRSRRAASGRRGAAHVPAEAGVLQLRNAGRGRQPSRPACAEAPEMQHLQGCALLLRGVQPGSVAET